MEPAPVPVLVAVEITPDDSILFVYADGTTFDTGSDEGEDTYSVALSLAEQANVELWCPPMCPVDYFEGI